MSYVGVKSKDTKHHTAPLKKKQGRKKSHQISSQNYQAVLVKTKRGRPWYVYMPHRHFGQHDKNNYPNK